MSYQCVLCNGSWSELPADAVLVASGRGYGTDLYVFNRDRLAHELKTIEDPPADAGSEPPHTPDQPETVLEPVMEPVAAEPPATEMAEPVAVEPGTAEPQAEQPDPYESSLVISWNPYNRSGACRRASGEVLQFGHEDIASQGELNLKAGKSFVWHRINGKRAVDVWIQMRLEQRN